MGFSGTVDLPIHFLGVGGNAAMIAGLGYHYLKDPNFTGDFVEASGRAPIIEKLPVFS